MILDKQEHVTLCIFWLALSPASGAMQIYTTPVSAHAQYTVTGAQPCAVCTDLPSSHLICYSEDY